MRIKQQGKVYLVGAGPGDPDLLTVKAVRILAQADVVLHDGLVSPEVMSLVRPDAKIVDVGKRCGQKSITQAEINRLLLQFSLAGHGTVRLKSGDPLIFGRAGEELDFLQQAGIEVEIVPGITAASAAGAAARISLTDRRSAQEVLIVSAHRGDGNNDEDWDRRVTQKTTVVIYMPGKYASIAARLMRAGLAHNTPCVLVSKVSCAGEQMHSATLGSLHRAPLLPTPCVLLAGKAIRVMASEERASLLQAAQLYPNFAQSPAQPITV